MTTGAAGRRRSRLGWRIQLWVALAGSILLCALIVALHYDHRQRLDQATVLLRDLGRASEDLSNGFLHLTLGTEPNSPWQRAQGAALLRQALASYERTAAGLGTEFPAQTTLRVRLAAFRTLLDETDALGGVLSPQQEVALRLKMFDLNQSADELDRQIRLDVERLALRLERRFGWALVLAAALLAGLCIVVYRAERARARSERELETIREGLEERVAERAAELEKASNALRESGAFLRTIADNQPALIAYWDASRRLRFANRAYLEWFGLDAQTAFGRSVQELFGEAFVARNAANRARVLDGEADSRAEEIAGAGGRAGIFWVHRLPDRQDGGARGMFFFAADITEIKRTEERLAQAERFSRLVADNIPGRVSYFDRERRVRFVNRTFCDWYGTTPEQMVGKLPEEVSEFWRQRADANAPHTQAVLAGVPQVFEREEIRRDGTTAIALVQYVPDQRQGEVHGFVVLATDITELKTAERRLRELNEELTLARDRAEAATRAKSAFLANMSHEIRTPMNAIVGLTHLVQRDVRDPAQRERLGRIADAARHLLEIINDILDLSKIEAGRLDLERVDFSVDEILSRTVDLIAPRARDKNLQMFVDPDGLPDMLCGDPTRLSQALLNLLGNAVKFTERGSVTLKASLLDETESGPRVRFDVIDTGIGIDRERVPLLFDAFVQADSSTTRRFGGTGLGLAITRRIAHLMDGEVGVESEPGRGSRFWFEAQFRNAVAASTRHTLMAGMRGLLVDDMPEAAAIGAIMRRLGLRTDSVASGAAALSAESAARADGDPYQVVVLDWLMPQMDGIEVARRLKEVAGPAAPAMVMVSARNGPEVALPAREAGIACVLGKPVTPSALHDSLLELLVHRTRAARQVAPAGADRDGLARALQGRRVLLAEDNPVNQEVAKELLRAVGVEVEVARDGEQAVRLAMERDFDLVLMDVQMPVLDGLQAARALRSGATARQVPIVAMTANAYLEDRQACMAAGMNDHIAKPVDAATLYAKLLRWIVHGGSSARAVAGLAAAPRSDGARGAPALDGIEGFDIDAGARRSGLDRAALLAPLRRFVALYRDGAPVLEQQVASGALRDLELAAHSLRGSSAALGATRIEALAAELESKAAHAAPREDLARLAAELHRSLGALATELHQRLDR